MIQQHSDNVDAALASLRPHEPARRRSAQTRARAHQALQRPRWDERVTTALRSVNPPRLVESAVVSAGVIYLISMLRLAARLASNG